MRADTKRFFWFAGVSFSTALFINCLFYRPPPDFSERPSYRPEVVSAPVTTTTLSASTGESYEERQRREREVEEERIARRKAAEAEALARKKALEEAEAHAKFLGKYINTNYVRVSGKKNVALLAVSEKHRVNRELTAALAGRFETNAVELTSSFFSPEFITDGLFEQVFDGSTTLYKKLELSKFLDGLAFSRQSVEYDTHSDLQNLVSAHMQIQVAVFSVEGADQTQAWTFKSNGAGFTEPAARVMAEERIIKQISTHTNLSLNSLFQQSL